jgi:hypothetical protein
MNTTARAALGVAASISAFATTLISGPWVPRFTFEPLNYWFVAASALAIPASLIWLAIAIPGFWRKALAFVAASSSAIPMVPLGLISLAEANSAAAGNNLSHLRLAEISRGHTTYRLYRTDCGATCAYGLQLRKEIDALGVIKLVSTVWSVDHEKDGALRLSPTGQVEVVRGEYVLHAADE